MRLSNIKEVCFGCSVCKHVCLSNAISMLEDDEGFLYPNIDTDKCTKCSSCEKVCPAINFSNGSMNKHIKVLAIKHCDDSIRIDSSSGGAFSALAVQVLKKYGAVYGASYDGFNKVKHKRVDDSSSLFALRNSKYVQSSLDDILEQLLTDMSENRIVLFTGTACQIDAVKRLCDFRKISIDNLYTCDILCHGVASPRIYSDYIDYLEKRHKSSICDFKFRSKAISWRGSSSYARFESGITLINTPEVCSYMNVYYSHNIMRNSCYSCPYSSLNRISDITISDYWGIETIYREFEDNLGVSMVLINTPKGEQLLNEINDCEILEANIESAKQPNLYNSCGKPANRDTFWDEYRKSGISFILKKYGAYGIKHSIHVYLNAIKKKMRFILHRGHKIS